jgi:hypothetical protein
VHVRSKELEMADTAQDSCHCSCLAHFKHTSHRSHCSGDWFGYVYGGLTKCLKSRKRDTVTLGGHLSSGLGSLGPCVAGWMNLDSPYSGLSR